MSTAVSNPSVPPSPRWLALPLRVATIALAAALVSGAVRGEAFDDWLASIVTRGSSALQTWLARG